MNEQIFIRIKELLRKRVGKKNLTIETTIQSLHMVSEEIDDFFDEFDKEFKVDGRGYNYYTFFFEQVHPGHILRDFFLRLFKPEKVRKKKLTLEHLVQVAEKGKWFDPE